MRRVFLSLSPFLLPFCLVCGLTWLCSDEPLTVSSWTPSSFSGFYFCFDCSIGFTASSPRPVRYPGVCLSVLNRSSCFSFILSFLYLNVRLHVGLHWQFEYVAIIRQINIFSEIIKKLRFEVLQDKFTFLPFLSPFSWPLKTPPFQQTSSVSLSVAFWISLNLAPHI